MLSYQDMEFYHHLAQIVSAVLLSFAIFLFNSKNSLSSLNTTDPTDSKFENYILFALFLAACGLRFIDVHGVYGGRLSVDENNHSVDVIAGALSGISSYGSTRLVSILSLYTVYELFGFAPLVSRYVSVFAGVLGTCFVYLSATQLLGPRHARWIAMMSWISITAIHFSRVALENVWVFVFMPAVIYFLLMYKSQRQFRYLLFAALSLFLGLYSYAGFAIGVASVSLSFLIVIRFFYSEKLAFKNFCSINRQHIFISLAIFICASIAALILTPNGISDYKGGGSLDLVGVPDNLWLMFADVFITAKTWYLQQPAMGMYELPFVPLALCGGYLILKKNRFLFYLIIVSIPICWLLASPTGMYYGARRIIYILIPFWFFSGVAASSIIRVCLQNINAIKFVTIASVLLSFSTVLAYAFTLGKHAEINNYPTGFWHPQLNENLLKYLAGKDNVYLSAQNVGGFSLSPEKKYYDAYMINHMKFNLHRTDYKTPKYLYGADLVQINSLPDQLLLLANTPFDAWGLLDAGYCLNLNSEKLNEQVLNPPYVLLFFEKGNDASEKSCTDVLLNTLHVDSNVEFCGTCFSSMLQQKSRCEGGECAHIWSDALYLEHSRLRFDLAVPNYKSRQHKISITVRTLFAAEYDNVIMKINGADFAPLNFGKLNAEAYHTHELFVTLAEQAKILTIELDLSKMKAPGLGIVRASVQ